MCTGKCVSGAALQNSYVAPDFVRVCECHSLLNLFGLSLAFDHFGYSVSWSGAWQKNTLCKPGEQGWICTDNLKALLEVSRSSLSSLILHAQSQVEMGHKSGSDSKTRYSRAVLEDSIGSSGLDCRTLEFRLVLNCHYKCRPKSGSDWSNSV